MTLRTIVGSLLPRDYREQVLGDLFERGFRLRDIADILPRVWASHLVRTITAPAPQIASANDAAILSRTEQLARQGALGFYVAYVAIWNLYLPFRRGLPHLAGWQMFAMCVATAVVAIPGYFLSLRRALPESTSLNRSRPQLLTGYRQQIDYQLTLAKSMVYGPSLVVVLWSFAWYRSQSLPTLLLVAFPVAIGLAVLAVRRISRLHRELNSLELAH